jgi:UDP-4-amino-4,6-dideoxy-N-acetyl-beta-L-altrosamine N-acetyltransferase
VNGARDVRPEDKELLRRWRNQANVARWMYNDHEISVEEHERWFSHAMADGTRRYWILTCEDRNVGLINLYDISKKDLRAYFAIYIADESVRGRGVGTFAQRFLQREAFETFGMNKLCCEVFASNEAALRLYRSCGFVDEGRLRQHVRKGGEFHDVLALAMLKSDWLAAIAGKDAP